MRNPAAAQRPERTKRTALYFRKSKQVRWVNENEAAFRYPTLLCGARTRGHGPTRSDGGTRSPALQACLPSFGGYILAEEPRAKIPEMRKMSVKTIPAMSAIICVVALSVHVLSVSVVLRLGPSRSSRPPSPSQRNLGLRRTAAKHQALHGQEAGPRALTRTRQSPRRWGRGGADDSALPRTPTLSHTRGDSALTHTTG